MWKLGRRDLPYGVQLGGGSDWFCLNYDLISFIVESKHEFLDKSMFFFNYTLLPSEVTFH